MFDFKQNQSYKTLQSEHVFCHLQALHSLHIIYYTEKEYIN